VGGRLLDDALAAADASAISAVYLEVRTSNQAARALYESRGFRMVGRRRSYYQQPTEDALVLRRTHPDTVGPPA
jgi:ribosomal-protein-alanine N-acetyltransferase